MQYKQRQMMLVQCTSIYVILCSRRLLFHPLTSTRLYFQRRLSRRAEHSTVHFCSSSVSIGSVGHRGQRSRPSRLASGLRCLRAAPAADPHPTFRLLEIQQHGVRLKHRLQFILS